jgi:serine/threonine protein kinase
MKKFKRSAHQVENDFLRELNALEHISELRNVHLTTLLTAFSHGEDFFLIFPLAESNLSECFRRSSPPSDTSYFRWMVDQLVGLAAGIQAIHGDAETGALSISPSAENKRIGYHHDLKPENILLFRNENNELLERSYTNLEVKYGRLQISDFGLGRFREVKSGSVSTHIKGTPTYAAPESATEKTQSRPYDIWSFGCILLECLIWLLKGPDELKTFMEDRFVKPLHCPTLN